MADDLKSKRNKLEETAMAGLNDDLILEIVKRLPIKYVVQCSVLNKNFRRWIFQPNFLPSYPTVFHCSGYSPKIFTTIWEEIRSTTIRPLLKSVTLDTQVSIIASCNGLLLLGFETSYLYYVFNPATVGITAVGKHGFGRRKTVGLAVLDNSRFKLVSVEAEAVDQHLKFTVIVPSTGSGESTRVESRTEFACLETLTLMTEDGIRPVYAHGVLYWLGNDGRSMVAFDVEMKEVRIIRGPVERNDLNRVYKWFGFADGSIHLVYVSQLEIVIRQYDRGSRKWRVRNTIPNMCNPRNNNYRNGTPVFFDGRRLVFVVRKSGEGGSVYRYDFVRDLWERIVDFPAWTDCHQHFFSYNPSFVKVSDTYLKEKNSSLWEDERKKNSLLGLQQLLVSA